LEGVPLGMLLGVLVPEESDMAGAAEGEAPRVWEGVGDTVWVEHALGEGVPVTLPVPAYVPVGEGEGVGVNEPEGVAAAELEGMEPGEGVTEPVPLPVGEGVLEGEGRARGRARWRRASRWARRWGWRLRLESS
jgi:hypothetical protein